MRKKFWLLICVAKASLITTIGLFILALVVVAFKIVPTRGEEGILAAATFFLSVGIAAAWMFRSLKTHCTSSKARTVATAFPVFTLISMAIAFPLAQIPWGYGAFLGRPFGVAAGFLGVVVMTTLLSYVLILFTLRFMESHRKDSEGRIACAASLNSPHL